MGLALRDCERYRLRAVPVQTSSYKPLGVCTRAIRRDPFSVRQRVRAQCPHETCAAWAQVDPRSCELVSWVDGEQGGKCFAPTSTMHNHKILLVTALGFAACDSSDRDVPLPPDVPADDLAFIDGLVPHHGMAIEMAREELARGTSEEVKAMAQEMINMQQAEIDLLVSVRRDLSGTSPIFKLEDPHGDRDLVELQQLAGLALDRTFLDEMIPHHAGAVILAHRALPNLERPELIDLAANTIQMQTREMNTMLDMRAELDE